MEKLLDPRLKACDLLKSWMKEDVSNRAVMALLPLYDEDAKGIDCRMVFNGHDDLLSVAFVSAMENNPQFADFVHACVATYNDMNKQNNTPKNYLS